MFRIGRIGGRVLAVIGGLVLLGAVFTQLVGAQDAAALRVVQGSDGTLYVVVGTTRYSITPDPILSTCTVRVEIKV
jgi:hypothetical protein